MDMRRFKQLTDNLAMSLLAGFFVNIAMSGVQPMFYVLPFLQPAFIIGAAVIFSIPLFAVVGVTTFFATLAVEHIRD